MCRGGLLLDLIESSKAGNKSAIATGPKLNEMWKNSGLPPLLTKDMAEDISLHVTTPGNSRNRKNSKEIR